MPNGTIRRLTQLTAAGMDVYPSSLRGLAANEVKRYASRLPKGRSAERFLEWVKLSHPRLFDAALKRANATASSASSGSARLGQTSTTAAPSPLDRVLNAITTLAPAYLQAKAQKDLLEVQLDRARNNLPPLNAAQYAPGVQVSLDPSMYTPQWEAAKPWLMYGALALSGLFIFRQLGKRRR